DHEPGVEDEVEPQPAAEVLDRGDRESRTGEQLVHPRVRRGRWTAVEEPERERPQHSAAQGASCEAAASAGEAPHHLLRGKPCRDRKSTRLNSSHVSISYAVFCLNKKRSNMTF